MLGETTPDLAGFRALAATHRVVPVMRELLADAETPVGVYRKVAQGRVGTFLLESAEHGRAWSRWSFVGAPAPAVLTESDGLAEWLGEPPAGVPRGMDPLAALRATVEHLSSPRPANLPGGISVPPLTGGMVGFVGYDAVRRIEKLPDLTPDELKLPELAMLFATDLVALDHERGTVILIANAVNWDGSDERVDQAYSHACERLDMLAAALAAPAPATVSTLDLHAGLEAESRTTPENYQAGVEACREHIRAGDAFQIVLSQRFTAPCPADALDVYRVLRASNPSPYMYLLRMPGPGGGEAGRFDIVGSSPEALVTVVDGAARMHPIAGTRPRGKTPAEDVVLGEDLLTDPKERAEHLMLVDLGRNDLGRVAAAGSVEVTEFMAVERFSHVMHLVSTVTASLAPGRNAFDALMACFPAGTLSGAPKPRAMEIIETLEPSRRGLYGGVVGYLDFAGDLDTAIAIRTAVIRDGVAYVQAGAGIVADSDPLTEHLECRAKAAAVLRAIAAATTMDPIGQPSPQQKPAT